MLHAIARNNTARVAGAALRHSRSSFGVPSINRAASLRVAFSHGTLRSLSTTPTPIPSPAASATSASATPVSSESKDEASSRSGHTWKEVQNHQGRVYFEHLTTKERSWDKPADPTETVWTLNDQAWASANADPFDSAEDKKLLPDASFGEKTFDALVNSKSLYWVAFGGAGVFLTVSYFSY